MYTPKSGQSKRLLKSRHKNTQLPITLSEETMGLQLMCHALTNPLSSQFQTEIGLDGR